MKFDAVSKSPTPEESATIDADAVPENASVTAASDNSGGQSVLNDDSADVDDDDEGLTDIKKQHAEHVYRKQEDEWLTKREKVSKCDAPTTRCP